MMPGRRYSEGLHQAIEAKEGVRVQPPERDAGHDHLPELLPHVRQAGRHDRYRQDRGRRIPSASTTSMSSRSRPTSRCPQDFRRSRLQDEAGKFDAVIAEIDEDDQERAARSRSAPPRSKHPNISAICSPAEDSTTKFSTPSNTSARRRSSRMRATRAPSRSPPTWPVAVPTSCSAKASPMLGGLHIIGTERHEARRIDNQLRGRAGRQGDPGSSSLLCLARRRADAPLRFRAHRRI